MPSQGAIIAPIPAVTVACEAAAYGGNEGVNDHPIMKASSELGSLHPLVGVALEAVYAAAEVCTRIQDEMVSVTAAKKKDRSPVTVADYASQAVVCRILSSREGNMPIVAEETADDLREQQEMLRQVTRFVRGREQDASASDVCSWIELGNQKPFGSFWTLDPIDGTAGFLRRQQYAIALAHIEDGDVKVAVLACPNLSFHGLESDETRGVLFVAVKGRGAYSASLTGESWNRVAVDEATGLESARFVESVESGHADHGTHQKIARALGITQPSVRIDSQAKYGVVARGDASIYLRLPSPATPDYRERIWDHAAGVLLVEEAGGRVTDIWGTPLDFSQGRRLERNEGVIVTNGHLHDRVLDSWQIVDKS
jgi:3'(2'), 5'-bisphosphate nucleotidase